MYTKTDGATGRPTRDAGYALPMAVSGATVDTS